MDAASLIEFGTKAFKNSAAVSAFRAVNLNLSRKKFPIASPRTKKHQNKKKEERSKNLRTLVSGMASRPFVFKQGTFSKPRVEFPEVVRVLLGSPDPRENIGVDALKKRQKAVNEKLKAVSVKFIKDYSIKKGVKQAAKLEKEQIKLLKKRFERTSEEKGMVEAHLFIRKQFKSHFKNVIKIFGLEKANAILKKSGLNSDKLNSKPVIGRKGPSNEDYMNASKLLIPLSSKVTVIDKRSKKLDLVQRLIESEEQRIPFEMLTEIIQEVKWKLSKRGIKPKIKLKNIQNLEDLQGFAVSSEMLESIFDKANIGYSPALKKIDEKHIKHLKKLGLADDKGQPLKAHETSYYRTLSHLKCDSKKNIDRQTRVGIAKISKKLGQMDYLLLTSIGGFNLLKPSRDVEAALMKKRILDVVEKNLKTPFWKESLV
jgi:hypothetical protein